MELKFTGECFILGQSNKISEEEHLERYLFASAFVSGKRVLDIACGEGYGSKILSEANASSVLGCDILADNITHAINKYKSPRLEFKVKNITKPLSEGEFDIITCFETIEHVDDFKSALDNLHASLKKDGKLIISSPNRKITNPYLGAHDRVSDYHIREFTIDEFISYISASHFELIEIYGQRQQQCFNNPFIEKHYKRLFKPSKNSSPKVEKIKEGLEPEYFTMIVRK
jgi:ubiquinone/menaquinone biosynthesis C-methylase UbiE